jgi:hypothetical protein
MRLRKKKLLKDRPSPASLNRHRKIRPTAGQRTQKSPTRAAGATNRSESITTRQSPLTDSSTRSGTVKSKRCASLISSRTPARVVSAPVLKYWNAEMPAFAEGATASDRYHASLRLLFMPPEANRWPLATAVWRYKQGLLYIQILNLGRPGPLVRSLHTIPCDSRRKAEWDLAQLRRFYRVIESDSRFTHLAPSDW